MTLQVRAPSALPLWSMAFALIGANYWAYTTEIESSAPAGIEMPAADPAAAPVPASEPPTLTLPAPSDLAETLARPLFLAERRPILPEATAQAVNPAAAAPPIELELAGTMQTDGTAQALIRTPEKREGQWVKTGGRIGPWTLVEVRPDAALVERDGAQSELRIKPPAPKPGG